MAQGLTGFAGGRPEPQPVIRLFSFLVDKAEVAGAGRALRRERQRVAAPMAAAAPSAALRASRPKTPRSSTSADGARAA